MDLQKRRELTLKAIAINPCEIVLTRRQRVDDGAGGWTDEDTQLIPRLSGSSSETVPPKRS